MDADRRWRWYLPALMATTALTKLLLAWRYPAFLTGDDVEVIETAAHYAVGLDYRPWVIRSLFHPLLLAFPFVKAGALAGLSDAHAMSFFAAWPDVAATTLGIWFVHRLAVSFALAPAAARAAGLLYALHWLPLAYGSTPYPRPISSVLLVAAFLMVARRPKALWPAAAAGGLAACAFAVRWSEGFVLLPLAGFLLWKAEGRRLAVLASLGAGFAVGTFLAVGLLDLATWGRPFASLVAFARFMEDPNLGGFQRRAFIWYGWSAFRWLGPILPLLVLLGARDRRSRAPLSIALGTLLLFSLSPLKELRYLQVCVPFLAVAGALGWERLQKRPGLSRIAAALALLAFAAWGAERTLALLRSKSRSAVEAAKLFARLEPPARTVALEQMWAYGERLYLGNAVAIRDLSPDRPLKLPAVETVLPDADAVALYDRDVTPELARLLADRGFAPCRRFSEEASLPVTAYLPAARPCPGR